MSLLREELLAGRAVALAGGVSDVVRERLEKLGARVNAFELDVERALAEEGVGDWARARSPLDALIYDAGEAFGEGGADGLLRPLEQAWTAVREVASGTLIPAGRGGKVVLLAPRATSGPFAQVVRAALENLARTLSVEWARYGITVTMIAPGARTADEDVAEVVGFLMSVAGDYFSGCRFSMPVTASPPAPSTACHG
jgi:NAD(P)-dependent dehydrogenase (short-subunit alcohol dehydrogenase family)